MADSEHVSRFCSGKRARSCQAVQVTGAVRQRHHTVPTVCVASRARVSPPSGLATPLISSKSHNLACIFLSGLILSYGLHRSQSIMSTNVRLLERPLQALAPPMDTLSAAAPPMPLRRQETHTCRSRGQTLLFDSFSHAAVSHIEHKTTSS